MAADNAAAPASASRRQAVAEAAPSRVVPKPVPQRQVQDTREYQIGQLRRRFSPKEASLANGVTSLSLQIRPSDPDFPFELDRLDVEIKIPASYPKGPPTLAVRNSDIPRGFAINVEHGWDKLVSERRGATLLSLTNALDKNLESFLSEQKAETVKMTIFKDTRHLETLPFDKKTGLSLQETPQQAQQQAPQPKRAPYIPEESFTREQMAEAKTRRALETRQIESRMGRLSMYQKSSDGIVYTLPLEPKRRPELPPGLQAVKSLQLIIPLLYPLQQIRVLLNDVDSEDAEPLEELFAQRATEQRQMSLMSHINYLTQNLHLLAKQAQQQHKAREAAKALERKGSAESGNATEAEAKEASHSASVDDVKSHIHVIPRPPEWSYGRESGSESSGSDEDSYDSDEDEEGGGVFLGSSTDAATSATTQTSEKGTAITLPSVELYGVELLQISSLSISVKCQRCKMANDVGGLKPGAEKETSCRKCAAELRATFRPELVHQGSTRAGFLDLVGCTVADLLPSTFVPTCSKCSTPTAQGLVSVRGETTTNVCRECHGRFTFKIPDVRFQTYSAARPTATGPGGPKRKAEKLGLRAGEPLPGRGACPHYRRSYRWFRFSCCDRVYPCDKCHDVETGGASGDGHVHEWANRMVCGWCSREQNYRVDSCGFCGRGVVGRKGTGFWEGGKGTRDKVLMRRGDKRKYRRTGGDAKKE